MDAQPTGVAQPVVFRYHRPELDHSKTVLGIARSDILRANIHVVREGGETNLHAHPKSDGFWLVLNGCARFYGEGDILIAEARQYEGVLLPRGYKYWFESASAEPLEILQVAASCVPMRSSTESRADRIDYTAPGEWLTSPE